MNRRKFIGSTLIGLFGISLIGRKIGYDSKLVSKVEKNLGTSIDLHSHATVTYKGIPDIKQLADHCIKIGLDCIVFTNFFDSRYEDLKKTWPSLRHFYEMQDFGRLFYAYNGDKILMVIKGQEVPTKQGHILTVGAASNIQDYRNLDETIKEAKDKDAIIIADHPFTKVWGGIGKENLEEYLDKYDAIEIFNSQNIALLPLIPILDQRGSNDLAREFSRQNNLPGVATSDSHRLNEIALSYITFKKSINYYDSDLVISSLRSIIKSKDFENVTRYNNWGSFVNWAVPFQIKSRLGY